jgi:hypothetical protein
MLLKIVIIAVSSFIGGWMIFDGIHVLQTGKYFGPEKPGPWSEIAVRVGIDPLKMGPVFILIGAMWAAFIAGLVFHQPWAFAMGIIACIATLWYLPIGTVLSILLLIALILLKHRLFS